MSEDAEVVGQTVSWLDTATNQTVVAVGPSMCSGTGCLSVAYNTLPSLQCEASGGYTYGFSVMCQ